MNLKKDLAMAQKEKATTWGGKRISQPLVAPKVIMIMFIPYMLIKYRNLAKPQTFTGQKSMGQMKTWR